MKKLNFRQYWDAVGTENIKDIVAEVESSMNYFRMIRYGNAKPGSKLALKIIDAARKYTAPYEPDLELMVIGVPKSSGKRGGRTIPPTRDFISARNSLMSEVKAV